jgi:hypothetical protein
VFSRSVKVAVGVVAASALAACGGQVKMGAAATFSSGPRITTASLNQLVDDWSKQFAAHPEADQIRQQISAQQGGFDTSSPPRMALQELIIFRIWDEAARERGVTATPGQVDDFIAKHGGQRIFELFTLARGLPVSQSHNLAKVGVIESEIADAGGPSGQSDQAAVTAAVTQAAGSLKIELNPRYGSFDPAKGFLPVKYTLSTPDSGLNGA